MKKLYSIYILIVLLAISPTAKTQNFLIGAGTGMATHSMSSSKEYNQTIINTLAFNPVVTDNFPPYFYINAEALYSFPATLAAGVAISTTSTGSRVHLADYSGEYTFDNLQNVVNLGAKLLLGKQPGKINGINFIVEGGIALSKMTIDEKIHLEAGNENYNEEFLSDGFYIQPGAAYYLNIFQHFQLAATLSYYMGFEKGYHTKDNNQAIIQFGENNKALKPEWNGLRAGLTLYWNTGNISVK